jgi:tRNA threonylcarbamoyladenosine modification (KEOPS) complex Cgi121 subunit
MLQYIKEQGKYLEITGYRNISFYKAEIFLKTNRKQTKQNIDIQFFDAELIATQEHLYFAVLNALQAFKNKTNLSKSPAMETLLFASTEDQIQKAIERCGIKPQTKNMAVVIIGEDPKQMQNALDVLNKGVSSEPDVSVLEMTKTKETKIKKVFKISNEELKTMENNGQKKAIINIVIEHVALLGTRI